MYNYAVEWWEEGTLDAVTTPEQLIDTVEMIVQGPSGPIGLPGPEGPQGVPGNPGVVLLQVGDPTPSPIVDGVLYIRLTS